MEASPSSLLTSVTSQAPSSPSTRTGSSRAFSRSLDQLEASRSVLRGSAKPGGPSGALGDRGRQNRALPDPPPPSPGGASRGPAGPRGSPVPVVDVGGVRALLHDPARVPLPPLGHGAAPQPAARPRRRTEGARSRPSPEAALRRPRAAPGPSGGAAARNAPAPPLCEGEKSRKGGRRLEKRLVCP